MKSAVLNSKDIIIGLKKHWSTQTFMEHYCYDSEESLFSAVDKAISNTNHASKVKQEMKENTRVEQKRISKKLKQFHQHIVETHDILQDENLVSEEVLPSASLPDESKEESITELKNYLNSLDKEIYSDEVLQKDLHFQRKSLFAEMRAIRQKIVSLQNQLESTQEDFNSKVLLLDSVSEALENINKDLDFLRKEQATTTEKIKQLEKNTIYMYVDGSITVDNFFGILPEADSELIKQYATDERFENLTLKELKQICKLIAIISILESEEKSFELIFDNSNTESVWQDLSSQPE